MNMLFALFITGLLTLVCLVELYFIVTRDAYIRKLEQRVRTLTLRVWESKDGLQRHSAFVPIYMSDDAEPESLHGVHLKEQP